MPSNQTACVAGIEKTGRSHLDSDPLARCKQRLLLVSAIESSVYTLRDDGDRVRATWLAVRLARLITALLIRITRLVNRVRRRRAVSDARVRIGRVVARCRARRCGDA